MKEGGSREGEPNVGSVQYGLIHTPEIVIERQVAHPSENKQDHLYARLIGVIVYIDREGRVAGTPERVEIRVHQPIGTTFHKEPGFATEVSDLRHRLNHTELCEFAEGAYRWAVGQLGVGTASGYGFCFTNCSIQTDISGRIRVMEADDGAW